MTRAIATVALALLVTLPTIADARREGGGARGGGSPSYRGHGYRGHGGSRHGGHGGPYRHYYGHGGPRVFFYGSFGPYWYPGFGYRPYYYPYPYYPAYPYPPAWAPYYPDRVDDADDDEPEEVAPPADAETASYGLIQLTGVPDGAAVELDGRFWLTATRLTGRWLALPRGEHRVSVAVGDAVPVVRTVHIVPGKMHVLRFGPERESPP